MTNNSNNKRNYCKPTPKHCNHENNLPSEFYQVERTITDINNHPPTPGENGYWMIWNPSTHKYEESTVPLPDGTLPSVSDDTKGWYLTNDGENIYWAEVQGGGEVNQNAFSNVAVKKQSEAVTAVAGQADDATIAATAKTDTITMATGNKWVDVNGTGKTITVGHALSGVTAGATGDASHVAKVTVDAAGHVTAVEAVAITPEAIGAAALGQAMDDKDTLSLYGVKALATQASADAAAAETLAKEKVASVTATNNGGITVGGTTTAPTVGIKLDPAEGNIATLSDAGLKVTIPDEIMNDITDLQTALIGVSDLIGGDA